MDPGTLVLQGAGGYTLLGNATKSETSPWTTANVPKNGDVPYAAALAVNAGTLVLDMPGLVTVTNASNDAYCWIASHHIPDGTGGAYPAVLEQRQGTFVTTCDMFVVGRHVDAGWDDYSQYSRRPYAAYNLYGGTAKFEGIIMGYSNYKYVQCVRNEINVFGGRLEVGPKRFAFPHEGSNVKIGDDYDEAVFNLYDGVVTKESGEAVQLGSYYGMA